MFHIYDFAQQEPHPSDIELTVNGCECPLHIARVSAVPFNRRWPGHQRPLDQTELVSFGQFSTDGPAEITIKTQRPWKEAIVRPLAKGCSVNRVADAIQFTIPGPGSYSVELDGPHNALLIFADPEGTASDTVPDCPNLHYFGAGYHDIGLLELHDNETVFLAEGAVVFACIKAVDAKNIRILGHGILDGSRNIEQPIDNPDQELWEEQRKKHFAITNVTRRHTIQLEYCDNVLIDGITIRDSLLYNIRPICCRRMVIENVKIIGNWRYNSDGIDMHNCSDVVIRRCFLRTYDDTICIKGFDYTQDEADMVHRGVTYDTARDIVIDQCVLWNDWGNSLEIGAETRAREICDILFENCDIIHLTNSALDSLNVDYADVHDIVYDNIRVEYQDGMQAPRLQESDDDVFAEDTSSTFLPCLFKSKICAIAEYSKDGTTRGINRNILFKDIAVTAPRMPASHFSGYDADHQCHDITIRHLTLNGKVISSLSEANISMNQFVFNIVITDH